MMRQAGGGCRIRRIGHQLAQLGHAQRLRRRRRLDLAFGQGLAVVEHFQQPPAERGHDRRALVRVDQDHRSDAGLGDGVPVAVVAGQVAAVADQGDAKALVLHQAHAVPRMLAQRHALGSPLQQVLGRDHAFAVGQPTLVQLVADVFDHIVDRGPRPSGGAVGDDLIVQVHVRQVLGPVQADRVRAGVVAFQGPRVVESGLGHAEWIEDQALHGLVVGRPDLQRRIDRVAGNEPGGRSHQVIVLEHLAEL